MKQEISRTILVTLGVCLGACGTGSGSSDGSGGAGGGSGLSPQCQATGYVAFDSANHQNQDLRLGVHAQINTWLGAMGTDASGAAAAFGDAKDLYVDPVAGTQLQEKVQGRLDQHVSGDPLQGDRLDTTVVDWLNFGATLGAGDELQTTIAKQWVDKTLQEFFFLSVHHELLDGARSHWDEAFGYYGSKSDNAEGALQGLALTAFKRDSTNGTNLEAAVFNDLIDGSCALDTALDAAGADSVALGDAPAVQSTVQRIDLNLQKVLAYSAGHEASEMQELLAAAPRDNDEIFVKAAELIPFFLPLERIMLAKGGASAARAVEIRSWIDAMPVWDPTSLDTTTTTWIDDLAVLGGGMTVPERIIDRLQVEFGIDVVG